jgi:hypothetical protein
MHWRLTQHISDIKNYYRNIKLECESQQYTRYQLATRFDNKIVTFGLFFRFYELGASGQC